MTSIDVRGIGTCLENRTWGGERPYEEGVNIRGLC